MGEIADMMIEGAMCQGCGEYLGDEVGYPRSCSSCSDDDKPKKPAKIKCSECGKKVHESGIDQHIADKHPAPKF